MSTSMEQRQLKIVCAGMIAGPLLFLGIAAWVRGNMQQPPAGLELVAWAACGVAAASPILASLLWSRLRGDAERPEFALRRRAHIVAGGILEGAAFFCAISLLVSRLDYGMYAALIPLVGMALFFPRD